MQENKSGIVISVPHFPGRAPIEAYGDGGFRFAGMSHRGSLLCLPAGTLAWEPMDEVFAEATYGDVFTHAPEIDILLIGTGTDLVPIRPVLKQRFREHGISADSMSTGAAVRTYNVLLAENRAVAAALLAVE